MLDKVEGELIGLRAITKAWDAKAYIRQVQLLIFDGVIPARKIGQTWVSTSRAVTAAKAAYDAMQKRVA